VIQARQHPLSPSCLTQFQRLPVFLAPPLAVVLPLLQAPRHCGVPLQELRLRLLLVARVVALQHTRGAGDAARGRVHNLSKGLNQEAGPTDPVKLDLESTKHGYVVATLSHTVPDHRSGVAAQVR
jgi:hypothetical protein